MRKILNKKLLFVVLSISAILYSTFGKASNVEPSHFNSVCVAIPANVKVIKSDSTYPNVRIVSQDKELVKLVDCNIDNGKLIINSKYDDSFFNEEYMNKLYIQIYSPVNLDITTTSKYQIQTKNIEAEKNDSSTNKGN